MTEQTDSRRRSAEAVIAHLSSIQSWQTITEEFRMGGAEVGQSMGVGNWRTAP